MEELCGIPVLGVVPYYKDIHIEEEDSVVLDYKRMQAIEGKVNVAVVLLRHLSNFTDFNMLERDERVHLYYTNNTEELAKADIILLPGSKSTLDDLYELRRNGVAQAILRAHRKGASVMGICGGYQMMGMEVRDPDGVEGDIRQLPGLGLLPMITTMQGEKVTRRVAFHFRDNETVCRGYEIHMGETELVSGSPVSPLNKLEDGKADGYLSIGNVWEAIFMVSLIIRFSSIFCWSLMLTSCIGRVRIMKPIKKNNMISWRHTCANT